MCYFQLSLLHLTIPFPNTEVCHALKSITHSLLPNVRLIGSKVSTFNTEDFCYLLCRFRSTPHALRLSININVLNMAEFRLSTLDQAAPRIHLRYALCFTCNNRDSTVITERLQRAVKSLVSEVPMLAGTVTTNDQQKPASVMVASEQVEEFAPTIRYLQGHTRSYNNIRHGGFAPRDIEGIHLTPLANLPEENHSLSCAIQANFIDGGLILVIYLHHAVADINGVNTILRLMSEGLPSRKLYHDDLESEAIVVSRARSRLSQDDGAPAFLSLARDIYQRQEQIRQQQDHHIHPDIRDDTAIIANNNRSGAPSYRSAIFIFKLDTLLQTTEMLNSRRTFRIDSPNSTIPTTDNLTPREVLIAILWRAYARARLPPTHDNDARTSISVPINLRPILNRPLNPYYLGNASLPALATSPTLSLTTPYTLSTLFLTANIIHAAASAKSSDLLTRSRISLLKSSTPERDWIPRPQLVVHDWTCSLPMMMEGQDMDLGLGLGAPDAVRRTGRGLGSVGDEVVLLPVNKRTRTWEVQVEVEERVMRGLVRDGGLRGFLAL